MTSDDLEALVEAVVQGDVDRVAIIARYNNIDGFDLFRLRQKIAASQIEGVYDAAWHKGWSQGYAEGRQVTKRTSKDVSQARLANP